MESSGKRSDRPKYRFFSNKFIGKGEEPGFLILNENSLLVCDEIPVPTLLSPCINFGENLSLEINQDVQGYPRILPAGSQADIGAYEVDQFNSFVTVRYFYDINQNGSRENDEPWLRFGRTTDHKGKTYVNTSEKGSKIFLRPGNQMVSYLEDPFGEWKLTNEKDHTFFVNSWEFQRDVSFGLFPLKTVSQLSSFMASDPVRCGKRSSFVIAASNAGTTTSDGQLRLRLDEKVSDIFFVDLPDITISDLEYEWNFVGLEPGQILAKSFFIQAPDQIVSGQTETIFSFCHHISGFTDTETIYYHAPVHCKDVSDEKVATPQHEDFHHLIDRPLTYTIRFQNTGIDFARNVIIHDVIDSSFDITSLKILHTSHDEVLSVFYDDISRQVSFEFKNIFLTDSFTHSEESRGYVTYSVTNKKEVPLQTVVENKAHIIFDNFSPVVTNTTKNILVDKIISLVGEENISPIQVFPNPTRDKVTFSQKVDLAELYTLQGQCIHKSASTDHLMMDFPTGIYILKLTSEGKVFTCKITVVD
ncbi:MAG: T9SS type A sorting domain-containing protein [Saprospiraceae bacterium]|nr:T9SS type A sorting domain-containing protein [Saprospiraceae bacterium]